jgi:rhamnosyltransferase
VHAPARHYYQWRNALLLARRDHVPAAWSASVLMRLAARAVLALLTGPQRFATLRMGLLGIADGLRGAGGERRSP